LKRRATRTVNGVVVLNKPRGLTSQQAVSRVKRLFMAGKAGHTGTLDPLAEGVLPVGLGESTKFSRFLLDADKVYLATARLGIRTTTGDSEGDILEERPVVTGEADLLSAAASQNGERLQLPPMYSALKVGGKALYQYARAGVEVERKPRNVIIYSLQIIDFKDNTFSFRVHCSKGTYIRTVAEEIGAQLGCGAHLTGLIREAAGRFALRDALTLEELEAMPESGRDAILHSVDAFAQDLPQLVLPGEGVSRLVCGQSLPLAGADGDYRLYARDGRFMGVGTIVAGVLQATRLMAGSVAPEGPV
jgi:tRNA pseudouridine55 synthase